MDVHREAKQDAGVLQLGGIPVAERADVLDDGVLDLTAHVPGVADVVVIAEDVAVLVAVADSVSTAALNICKSVLEELTVQAVTRKGYRKERVAFIAYAGQEQLALVEADAVDRAL